ncbi:MAG: zinc-dependent alcohol dehydrogenase family protein [Thermoleophilaceae bacterium]|nr:zinc-dependent alcohol dehydrogenase family protein [Thermoleophilaceae bacterium]
MEFRAVGRPLEPVDRDAPVAGVDQLLLTVEACGVCRTDLHLIDGEVAIADPPRILGHQIVGRAIDGRRFGVPWLGWTCGACKYCTSGRENLCPQAQFTGCDIDGGFAEQTVVDKRYAFPLPDDAGAADLAPLLCAGLIGYRCLRMCGDAQRLGIYGFGAAAHLITQVAVHQGREVYAFTRAGDDAAQSDARELGAVWAGGSEERPPDELDAAIIFAPVGALVPLALAAIAPGGTVVCGGIHMSEIPAFSYDLLWGERQLRSVANLTRLDGEEFLELAPSIPVVSKTTIYSLDQTNEALADLRAGNFTGSAVIVPGTPMSP